MGVAPNKSVTIEGVEYNVEYRDRGARIRSNFVHIAEILVGDMPTIQVNINVQTSSNVGFCWKSHRIEGLTLVKTVTLSNNKGTICNAFPYRFTAVGYEISRRWNQGQYEIPFITGGKLNIGIETKDKKLWSLIREISEKCKIIFEMIEDEVSSYDDFAKYVDDFNKSDKGKECFRKSITDLAEHLMKLDDPLRNQHPRGNGTLSVDLVRKVMENPGYVKAILNWYSLDKRMFHEYSDEDLEEAISIYNLKRVTER